MLDLEEECSKSRHQCKKLMDSLNVEKKTRYLWNGIIYWRVMENSSFLALFPCNRKSASTLYGTAVCKEQDVVKEQQDQLMEMEEDHRAVAEEICTLLEIDNRALQDVVKEQQDTLGKIEEEQRAILARFPCNRKSASTLCRK